MKICEKCGAHNSDERNFCIDCSETLGDPISREREKEITEGIEKTLEKIQNKNDPLVVTPFDKILGYVSIIGIFILIGLFIAGIITSTDSGFLLLGILLFAFSALDSFIPAIAWEIEKFRLSILYSNTDDVEPGAFYKTGRKIGIIISTTIGIIILISGIFNFVNNFNRNPAIDLIDNIANYKPVSAVSLSSNPNDLNGYILASPEEWEEIINGGEKTVDALIEELKKSEIVGIRELLMMRAINEITELNIPYGSASEFVSEYTISTSLQKNY